jgi:ribosomal protein S18 acetylase RimI-like enzyme
LTFAVRQLGAGDLASYREIRLEALREHPDAFGASYEAVAGREDSYFADAVERLAIFGAFAMESGRQIGLAAFARHEGAKLMHRGDLIQMYVRSEARGSGCSLALVEAVLEHARPLVAQVHLGVATNNGPAIRLYERAGFHIYGTEPRSLYVNGRYIDEHLMVRFLDKAPGKKNDNA